MSPAPVTSHRGLLLVDKPSGPTSHDVVAIIRRGTGVKRVGHAGTLDPLASGLLVICLGAATRLSEFLAAKDKRYQALARLGQATTTFDAQGEVIEEHTAIPDREAVEAALAGFVGQQMQVPPQFSAIKRGGQKAYEAARRGEHLELEPRPVTIYSIDITDWKPPTVAMDVHCSAGTYIRSLAHDLGQRLGCGAHLAALRRTASGGLSVASAVALDQLRGEMEAGTWAPRLLPPGSGLGEWPAAHLGDETVARLLHGQVVAMAADLADLPDGLVRAYNPAGELIGILRADTAAGLLRPHKIFQPD